ARVSAVAVGGFVPTAPSLLPRIAALVTCGPGEHAFVDPCAGEGEAIFTLAGLMAPPTQEEHDSKPGHFYTVHRASVFACEMEATRHSALKEQDKGFAFVHVEHGDAFRL